MVNYYFKTAWINIKSRKLSSLINVAGLVLGMSISIIILLWVFNQLSYDRIHEKNDRTYQLYKEWVVSRKNNINSGTAPALVPSMAADLPEIEKYARFRVFIQRERNNNLIKYKDVVFSEEFFGFADTDFFQIFSFPFLEGDPNTALLDPNSIVLTASFSKKIFGDEDPMGKVIQVDNNFNFKVTGILKDVPENSSLQFVSLIPFIRITDFMPENGNYDINGNWGLHFFQSYILLKEGTDIENFRQKAYGYLQARQPEFENNWQYYIHLMPLKNMYLESDKIIGGAANKKGNKSNVNMFLIISGLLLLVSCINFMTLTTARSSIRAKEVGIKKTFGALRKNLIIQFYLETLLMAILSLLISLAIVKLILPFCNQLIGETLSFSSFGSIKIVGVLILITLASSVMAGSYPALLLSNFRPIKVLYGASGNKQGGNLFRKILVLIQFTFSVALIIGTVIIFSQYSFIRNKDLGFDYKNTVTINVSGKYLEKFDFIKTELLKNPDIVNVTASTAAMSAGAYSSSNFLWMGADEKFINGGGDFGFNHIEHDFLKTFGIKLIMGEDLSPSVKMRHKEIIINESTLGRMNIENPIGMKVVPHRGSFDKEHNIIGIIKDFHFQTLKSEIRPLVLSYDPRMFRFIYVKINPENKTNAINHIEKTLLSADPNIPFEYQFLEVEFDKLYRAEAFMANLFGIFSIILVIITCLGLFALSAFTAEQKIKEIGIRKTFGASMKDIVLLLVKSIIYLTILANIIAWPIAYYLFDKWLDNFAYHIDLRPWIFILSFFISMGISLTIVIYQSVKAGRSNPLDSLRYQ
ncbi:MAG: ABC transporter permease [Bacteroidetes bacterium]|nr:ABC transporter permease [Bacteroidota bacterium]